MALIGNLVAKIMSDSSQFRAGIDDAIRHSQRLNNSITDMTRGSASWANMVNTITPGLQSQIPVLGTINTALAAAMNTNNIIKASQAGILFLTTAWRNTVIVVSGAYKGIIAWITGAATAQAGLTASAITWATVTGIGIPLVVAGIAAGATYMATMNSNVQATDVSMKTLTQSTKEYYDMLAGRSKDIVESLKTPLDVLTKKQNELASIPKRVSDAMRAAKVLEGNISGDQAVLGKITKSGPERDYWEQKLKEDQEALKAVRGFHANAPNAEQLASAMKNAQQEYFKSLGVENIVTAQETKDAAMKNLEIAMATGELSQTQYNRNLARIIKTFEQTDIEEQKKNRAAREYAASLDGFKNQFSAMAITPIDAYNQAMFDFTQVMDGYTKTVDGVVEHVSGFSLEQQAKVFRALDDQLASSMGLSDVLKAMQSPAELLAKRLDDLASFADETGKSQEWLAEASVKLREMYEDKAKKEAAASLRSENAAALRGSTAAYRASYEAKFGNQQLESSKRIEKEQQKGNQLASKGNDILSNIASKFKGGGVTNFQTYMG